MADRTILQSDLDRECPMRHGELASQIADETRQIIEPIIKKNGGKPPLPFWVKAILIPLIPVLIGGGITVYIHQDNKREVAREKRSKRRHARQLKQRALDRKLARIEAYLKK